MKLTKIFTEHPHGTGETYFQHMRFALGFARQTFGASLAALTHAFFPNIHTTTASDRIRSLNKCLESADREAFKLGKAAVDTETAVQPRLAPDLHTGNSDGHEHRVRAPHRY